MKIEWTEPAVEDLAGIRDHIARDSELYAGRFIGRIPEAAEGYRIIYRLTGQKIQILSVLHGSRDLLQREQKPWEIT